MRRLLERNCFRLKLDRIAGEPELAEGSISRRWPSSKALPATKSDVHVHYAHGSIRTSRSTAMSPRVVQLSRSQVALHVGRSLCFFFFFLTLTCFQRALRVSIEKMRAHGVAHACLTDRIKLRASQSIRQQRETVGHERYSL